MDKTKSLKINIEQFSYTPSNPIFLIIAQDNIPRNNLIHNKKGLANARPYD